MTAAPTENKYLQNTPRSSHYKQFCSLQLVVDMCHVQLYKKQKAFQKKLLLFPALSLAGFALAAFVLVLGNF